MEEIAKYGDWTIPHLSKWKNLLLQNAITPILQYAYKTGENATDSAMIIDAMDMYRNYKGSFREIGQAVWVSYRPFFCRGAGL